jgi:hypothetical protein
MEEPDNTWKRETTMPHAGWVPLQNKHNASSIVDVAMLIYTGCKAGYVDFA